MRYLNWADPLLQDEIETQLAEWFAGEDNYHILEEKIHAIRSGTTLSIEYDSKNIAVLKIIKVIGRGKYSKVYAVQPVQPGLIRSGVSLCTLKASVVPCPWEYYMYRKIEKYMIPKMKKHFLSVFKIFDSDFGSFLLTEFVPFGSLQDLMNEYQKENTKLKEFQVIKILIQLLHMVSFLHKIRVIHCDLKLDNILIETNSYDSRLVLIDFGHSIDLSLLESEDIAFTGKRCVSGFDCIQMKEKKPWKYDADLTGIAGIIHALIFGRYMQTVMGKNDIVTISQKIPRKWSSTFWLQFFTITLNQRMTSAHESIEILENLDKIVHDEFPKLK